MQAGSGQVPLRCLTQFSILWHAGSGLVPLRYLTQLWHAGRQCRCLLGALLNSQLQHGHFGRPGNSKEGGIQCQVQSSHSILFPQVCICMCARICNQCQVQSGMLQFYPSAIEACAYIAFQCSGLLCKLGGLHLYEKLSLEEGQAIKQTDLVDTPFNVKLES